MASFVQRQQYFSPLLRQNVQQKSPQGVSVQVVGPSRQGRQGVKWLLHCFEVREQRDVNAATQSAHTFLLTLRPHAGGALHIQGGSPLLITIPTGDSKPGQVDKED